MTVAANSLACSGDTLPKSIPRKVVLSPSRNRSRSAGNHTPTGRAAPVVMPIQSGAITRAARTIPTEAVWLKPRTDHEL